MKIKKWFTLVEMLIVVVIIWILSASLIPRLIGAQSQARDVARKAWINQLQWWLENYYNNFWYYSAGSFFLENGLYSFWCVSWSLEVILINNWIMSSLPMDPQKNKKHYWKNTFTYTNVSPLFVQPPLNYTTLLDGQHRSKDHDNCIWSYVYMLSWLGSWDNNSQYSNAYIISANMENEKNNNLIIPPTPSRSFSRWNWYFYDWFWEANLDYYKSKVCNKWIKITNNVTDILCQTSEPNRAVNAIFTVR